MGHRIHLSVLFGLGLFLVSCDLMTKGLAFHLLKDRVPLELYTCLDLRYIENYDVAFHLMRWLPASMRYTVILTIGLCTSLAFLLLFLLWGCRHRWPGLGFIFILSGAAGNIFDRWLRGFVVDFIHIHVYNVSWPVFNLADIYVSVGIVILVLSLPHTLSTPEHLIYPPPPLPPHRPFLRPIDSYLSSSLPPKL